MNVVDRPELCDFIVPSVVRRGLLSIAISTAGASPAWARRIRERLEKEFGEEYARLFDALARVRKALLAEIPDPARRRKALVRLADESLVELARSASEDEIVTELLRLAREEVGEE
ncbi:MAG: precorrin-2 dehydrogenase/sirohydrochlorin ferrochelatase family protein [Planctomycetota bacterium]